MRRRFREFLRKRLLIGAMCGLAGIMLITAITTHGGPALDTGAAVQELVQAAAQTDDAGLAITDTAIMAKEDAAYTAKTIARQEGIQPGADQSVPIALTAAPHDIAGKEIDIATTIEEQIRHAVAPKHLQPFARIVS